MDFLALYSTNVNKKLYYFNTVYPLDIQKVTQIVYVLYINNCNLHNKYDEFIKIGTCTLNRFYDRYTEHTRKFSTNISVIDIIIIANASVEKSFHTFMEKNYPNLLLEIESVDGHYKEIYKYDNKVFKLFYDFF